jgi:sulfur-carrier protein
VVEDISRTRGTVLVKFFATFRKLTGDSSCGVDGSSTTVNEVLRVLSDRYGPAFRSAVFDNDQLSETVIILVNGRDLRYTGGLNTPVSSEDEISVFPVVAGG